MRFHRRGGFTIMELMVAMTLLTVIAALVFAPLIKSIAFVDRESSLLAMDENAERAMNEITAALRQAMLPFATYPPSRVPVAIDNITSFQDLLNSEIGFGINGVAWHRAFTAGTDFIPFAVSVDFGGDGDSLDADLLPELGIILPTGQQVPAGQYSIVNGKNHLLHVPGSLHPSLSQATPDAFGSDVVNPTASQVDLSQPRFANEFVFPGNGNSFGVIRFVPFRIGDPAQNTFHILNEWELPKPGSQSKGYDLNENGSVKDSFVLGRLEIAYADAGGTVMTRIISGPMVLLQLNRDSPSWQPLFQLVRYAKGDSTSGTPAADGGYALLVNLLLYDYLHQSTKPMSFDANIPFLTRQYQTLVKLRNQSNNIAIK